MNWTEVTIKTTTEAVEAISNILMEERCVGVMIEDPKDFLFQKKNELDWDYVEEEVFNKSGQDGVLIKTYIPEERNVLELIETVKARISLLPSFGLDLGEGSVSLSNVNESDWANEWKKYYKPTKVGKKIVVKPSWEDYEKQEGDLIIELDPGMAFGTGTHETIRLCLELLSEYGGPDSEILDVGTGSGILAVAGVLLGAQKALGVDIDELSVKTAKQNAKLNGVDNKTEFICGNLTDKVSGKFNIVTANIVADVIIMLNNDILKFLDKDGIYIMSGIIDTRENDVLENLKGKFEVLKIIRERGWTAIAAKPL